MSSSASNREVLLGAAEQVLERAGFAVAIQTLAATSRTWLLAENELFGLGVIAGDTLDELQPIESIAADTLFQRLGGLNGGGKRWDGYLVLLTPQRWRNIDSRDRVEVVYNTRGIRRLIGAELLPDENGDVEPSVVRALTVFLPLRDPFQVRLDDLDEALTEALIVNGIDSEAAPRYVAAYRARGTLDDL